MSFPDEIKYSTRFFALSLLLSPTGASAAFSPSSWLNFNRSADEVNRNCREVRDHVDSELKTLTEIPDAHRSFVNTPAALESALWDLSDQTASDTFLKDVSVSSSVRDAGHDCATLVEKFDVDVFSREDLYKAVKSYADRHEALQGEDQRLLERELQDFKKNGLMLSPEDRKTLKDIRQKIIVLQDAFDKNVAETTSYLLLSKDELAGLPDDYLAGLSKEGDRYKVTVDYPDYYPFMANAKNADARRRLQALFDNRGYPENVSIFETTLKLRQQAAQLLGYPDHASYVLALDNRMAQTPTAVTQFISDLKDQLKPLGEEELKVLVALKNQEEGPKSDGTIHIWDWRYYDNQLNKSKYAVNQDQIKRYFPLNSVVKGMFEVYQRLLGVKFVEVPSAAAWAPDVTLYQITDASGGPVIGYFYTDLFPRPGKYKHAASFDIVKARLLPDGTYQKPVSAIVANFPKPSAGNPSYLTHGESGDIVTLFHEFGHVMHQTLTKAKYGRFSGSSVAEDFVEAPSQMMENWPWQPEVIRMIKDPAKPFPPELLKKMIAAKNVDAGLRYLRQDFFATVDMRYHTQPLVDDPTAVYAELMKNIELISMAPDTHPEASFEHLMDGYDAGYYGYLWSKVYAQDMFSRFKDIGVLNPTVGSVYRKDILEPGGGRDEMASLTTFLGRKPRNDAFLQSLGLKPARRSGESPMSPELQKQMLAAKLVVGNALKADPDNFQLWKSLGFIRLKLGDKLGAAEAFKKTYGSQGKPDTKVLIRQLENAAALSSEEKNQELRAQDVMVSALKKDPNNSELWRQLGFIRKELGDEAGSRHAFAKVAALNSSSGDPASNFMLGLIYEKEKETAKAIESFNGCLASANIDVRTACARHLNHLGNR